MLSEEEAQAFAGEMLRDGGLRELVILSTCNRSEIYGVTDVPAEARMRVESAWGKRRGVGEDEFRGHGYFFVRGEAVRHLFRVIGSLDSLVLGEMQILGQVKEAYQRAAENRWTDFYLNRVFQAGLHAGKRIHAETAIHAGAVSIAAAAVDLARKVLGEIAGKTVGVVGAGEMGELAAQHLHKAGARDFVFFNRSREAAERLAAAFGGEIRLLPELPDHLARCDVLVAATGASGLVITAEQVRNAARPRQGRPLFLIDIAAPRDIDPAAGEIENTFLFSIDDLKRVTDGNAEARRQAAQQAEAVAEEEATKIEAWEKGLEIVPVLRDLRERYRAMTEKEIGKWAADLPPNLRPRLESLGHGLLNKFLHGPTTQLKRLGEQGDAQRAGYYANLLFALTDGEDGNDSP